jgi:glycerol-3-phosphate dehydrogenase
MSIIADYDIVVIGGGINGTAIAADAAGRGLKVLLCEAEDLASATSSASSKLIHGGLRYLEHFEFRLVREALSEREILLNKAPHNIRPLRFIMPDNRLIRSPWLIRLGLFLYDHLGGRKLLPASRRINLRQSAEGSLFKSEFVRGFSYYDCWTDDARLVVLNALCAHEMGAQIKTRTRFSNAHRQNDRWNITLIDNNSQTEQHITSTAIINAAGPWANEILNNHLNLTAERHITWVKGSHIIVKQIHPTSNAFILQNNDQRVIFILPYLNKYSLIGTTDVNYQDDLRNVRISEAETQYLLDSVNHYLKSPLSTSDILNSYAGVRALAATNKDNLAEITRDYVLAVDDKQDQLPILSVFGGKITTHREMAEHALDKLKKYFPTMKSSWTANFPLPGGNILNADFERFLTTLYQEYSQLDSALVLRYAHQYGTRIHTILKHTNNPIILGENVADDLYQCEVEYLVNTEWAQTANDILWRRTKLGYSFPNDKISSLESTIQKIINKNI